MNKLVLNVILQKKEKAHIPVILDLKGNQTLSRESDERLQTIAAGLRRLPFCRFLSADASDQEVDAILCEVHAREYLEFLSHWSQKLRDGRLLFYHKYIAPHIEGDTPLVAGIYDVAFEGVRVATTAALQLVRYHLPFTYALCRPPGHHAGPSWLGGYCYLNNAVAAVFTLRKAGISRISLLDFDFHFGNGSAALLERLPNIFFGSIHCSTKISYPYIETYPAHRQQVFIPFEHSPTPSEFLTGFARLLKEALDFGCSAIIVSVGYDIIAGDPHGKWNLSPSILEEVGELLSDCSAPLCFIQEGGYLLTDLEECAFRFGRGVLKKEIKESE